jgi:hypothetical protein
LTYGGGKYRREEVVAVTVFVLTALGVLLALLVVGGIVAVRRARRRIGRWRVRLLELRTRFLPPGPRRDAARLRFRLHAELRATGEMLEAAPQGVIFRADATAVLQELASTAAVMDGELAAIERFLDPAQQRVALDTVAPQVMELIETTYSARQTILRTAAEDRVRRLSQLGADVAAQAAALETYRRDGRELRL